MLICLILCSGFILKVVKLLKQKLDNDLKCLKFKRQSYRFENFDS